MVDNRKVTQQFLDRPIRRRSIVTQHRPLVRVFEHEPAQQIAAGICSLHPRQFGHVQTGFGIGGRAFGVAQRPIELGCAPFLKVGAVGVGNAEQLADHQ